MEGVQTYGGHPNIQESISKHTEGESKHAIFVYLNMYSRHLNIRGDPNIWGHMDTPYEVLNRMLSLCCVSKHRGHPNIWGASKHMGLSKAYREASKHMGYPNIQGDHPNIWQAPQHTGGHFKYVDM